MVLALHESAAARGAIRRTVPGPALRVVWCRAPVQLEERLRRTLVEAVVIDVRDEWMDFALALAPRFPRIPIIAYSRFGPDDGVRLLRCADAGLDVLVEGVDDGIAGEYVLQRSATAARRAALVAAPRLLRLTEEVQRRAWDAVLARAAVPTTTADIARRLRRSREHLSREFAAGGAPNLKRAIDLVRVAWAADLLGNPGYTVGVVARILGYASPSHLALASRRVTGGSASELGGLGPTGVLERFRCGRTRSRL